MTLWFNAPNSRSAALMPLTEPRIGPNFAQPQPARIQSVDSGLALLQKNVLNQQRWTTRDQLRLAIVTWIERTYHRRRRQTALGRLTPIEYETIINPAATMAA